MIPGFLYEGNLKTNIIPAIGDISCEALCQSQFEGCTKNCVALARTCGRRDSCWKQVEGCHDACEASRGFCMGSCHSWPW